MAATVMWPGFRPVFCFGCGVEISRETRIALAVRTREAGWTAREDELCAGCAEKARLNPRMTVTEFAGYLAECGFSGPPAMTMTEFAAHLVESGSAAMDIGRS